MSFGRSRTTWRLLSPVIAVAWALAFVALTGSAHADSTHGRGPTQGPSQAAAATTSATTAAGAGSTVHGRAHGGTSGDVTKPQPISRADANSGGANGQCPGGPYCSTRDGSPSLNGNGGGRAVGKPCAGCVGKADNKNPHGQMPNGTDHNAGYECDTNHGIGRTNPAHTGCATTPNPGCVPTPEVPCVPPPPCVPTETVPCVPSPPNPACVPTPTVPCGPTNSGVVSPVQVSAPTAGAPAAAAPRPSASRGPVAGVLPSTGAPAFLAGLTLAGFAAVVSGSALLVRRRRPIGGSTG